MNEHNAKAPLPPIYFSELYGKHIENLKSKSLRLYPFLSYDSEEMKEYIAEMSNLSGQ